MENNTPPSKLDETIKEHLSNYDAKYDTGDWSRMERMLDAAPKSMAPSGSYNKAIIIGAAVLVGGFLIFKVVGSSKSTPETSTETTVTPTETKIEPIPTPAPVVAKTITSPAPKEQPTVIPESKTPVMPVAKTVVPEVKTPVNSKEASDKALAEKTRKEKEKKLKNTKLDPESLKNQKVSVMGKEPIFGDQLDSSKGIVRETKEKESTKKQAVSKGSGTVGLGLGSLLLNADSIKKQQERMQKDTLHN